MITAVTFTSMIPDCDGWWVSFARCGGRVVTSARFHGRVTPIKDVTDDILVVGELLMLATALGMTLGLDPEVIAAVLSAMMNDQR